MSPVHDLTRSDPQRWPSRLPTINRRERGSHPQTTPEDLGLGRRGPAARPGHRAGLEGLLPGRHSGPVRPRGRRWDGVRRDDLPGRLRRHARPQRERVSQVPPAQTQGASGCRIASSVSTGAECGADQRTTTAARRRSWPLGRRSDHRGSQPVRRFDVG